MVLYFLICLFLKYEGTKVTSFYSVSLGALEACEVSEGN